MNKPLFELKETCNIQDATDKLGVGVVIEKDMIVLVFKDCSYKIKR